MSADIHFQRLELLSSLVLEDCHGHIQRGFKGVSRHPYLRNPVGHSSVLGTAMKTKRREEEKKKRRG
jgi:hypothetical protein